MTEFNKCKWLLGYILGPFPEEHGNPIYYEGWQEVQKEDIHHVHRAVLVECERVAPEGSNGWDLEPLT